MDTEKVIEKGVAFIAQEQQKDGGFLCLTTTKVNNFARANTVHAIVPSNIILSCLNTLKETDHLRTIKKKVAEFLLSQKSAYWSFNYWFRNSPESARLPYPDDLDDTFCALAALQMYDPSIIDGEALGKIATILTSAEEKVGGPYDMWLTRPEDKEKWRRIDLVVNSNIAYFLSLNDVALPRVNRFIEQSIDKEDYIFPYCSIYPAIYFISRFYRGRKIPKMVSVILAQQKNGIWGNPLYTALALLSLHNLSAEISPAIMQKGLDYLLKTQKKDGSWGPYAFYVELQTKEKNYYAGSSALTTAFCLEAIYKIKNKSDLPTRFRTCLRACLCVGHGRQANTHRQTQAGKQKHANKNSKTDEEKMQKEIIKSARARFSLLGDDVKKQFEIALARVRKMDKDNHITLLPYLFFKNLSSEEQSKVRGDKDDLLANLCRANLYGWIAYTIYDDILDEEGDPKLLSVANVCLREITHIYERVAVEYPEVAKTFHTTLDAIDSANAWEVSNCRDKSWVHIPNYVLLGKSDLPSNLANRSLGHALGPIALFLILRYKENSPEIQGLRAFFEHYLIARQLNDDAHDWEDDLKKGHLNAVGAQVLTKASRRAITHAREKGDFLLMETLFWNTIIDTVCRNVTTHTRYAQKALAKFAHCIADDTLFTTLLAGPEAMVSKTKKEKADTLKFLKAF